MKNKVKKFTRNKVIPKMMSFVNSKAMQAVAQSMISLIPLIIIGSLFLIIWNFPVPAVTNFLDSVGWRDYFLKVFNASSGIVALVTVYNIAYNYAKAYDINPTGYGATGLMTYILICTDKVILSDNITAGGVFGSVFDMTWAGNQGMIGAIIVGLLTGVVYTWLIRKNVRIKLPKQVPVGVQDSFSALIPTFICAISGMLIYAICDQYGTTIMQLIYTLIQMPLQGISNNWYAVVASVLIMTICWWFGIHGGSINSAIFGSILAANTLANANITASGLAVNAASGGYIFTDGFNYCFLIETGTGITIGIALYMLFFAKSETFKALGKLSIVPSLFNINEPILFGVPVVLNPILFLPFVLTPLVSGILSYFLINVGIVPYHTGILAPSLTPPIIQGLIDSGWRWAILQAIIIVISFLIYFPFMKKADAIQVQKELENDDETYTGKTESDTKKIDNEQGATVKA